ncbi:Sucrose transport protein SUC4 [Camellia lanceoleosa]|uniref:Sucrose transport protein SUC4 n=1 Tax=Camellia lanceoleosa TaxID=1840588 RepID=A0ACC0GCJ8_9ERIC|nr:Sucrose transport protein SUC4 [Camellia lanceoleosa]
MPPPLTSPLSLMATLPQPPSLASNDCLDSGTAKPHAITIFVLEFWILDIGNNLLIDPNRAFITDLFDGDQRKCCIHLLHRHRPRPWLHCRIVLKPPPLLPLHLNTVNEDPILRFSEEKNDKAMSFFRFFRGEEENE